MTRKALISPGFGAGWSTWNPNYRADFLFDAELIEAVEAGIDLGVPKMIEEPRSDSPLGAFVKRLIAKHGEDARHVYLGGARDLTVQEVEGQFYVREYDGSEGIVRREDGDLWI